MKKVFFSGLMIFLSIVAGVMVNAATINLLGDQEVDNLDSLNLVGLEFVNGDKYVFTKVDSFENTDFVVKLNNTDDINYFLENYGSMGEMEKIAFIHNKFEVPIEVLLDMDSLIKGKAEVSE